jgi:hypothetical protein
MYNVLKKIKRCFGEIPSPFSGCHFKLKLQTNLLVVCRYYFIPDAIDEKKLPTKWIFGKFFDDGCETGVVTKR